MNPLLKFVLLSSAVITLLLFGAAALLAFTLFHSGTVHVEVHESSPHREVDIDLPLPYGVVAGAIDLIGLAPTSHRHRHAVPGSEDWRPAARAACQALTESPDGVLLEVARQGQTVRIFKRHDMLDIQVQAPGKDVHITTPASLLRHLANIV